MKEESQINGLMGAGIDLYTLSSFWFADGSVYSEWFMQLLWM